MIRKLLILMLLGSVLACAGVVGFFFETPEGKALAAGMVQDMLERETGIQVDLGGVTVDPWTASLELEGVEVHGEGAPRMAGVQRVLVSLAPLQLLGGAVVVDRVDVNRPHVNLVIRDGRIVGLPVLKKSIPDEEGGKRDLDFFRLRIRQLRVTGLDVNVKVEGKHPVDVELTGLRASLDDEGPDLHSMAFALERGVITLPTGGVAHLNMMHGEATLQGDGLLRPEQLDIVDAMMEMDTIRGRTQGKVRFAPLSTGLIPAADLRISAVVPLSQFNAYNPRLLPLGGTVSFNAHVRSAFGARNPTAIGDGELRDIEINGFQLDTFSGDFFADPTGVDFTNVHADYATADIEGQGRVNFSSDFKEITASFSATGKHGRFAQAMENLRVSGSWVDFLVDAEVEFAGMVYPEFKFKGHGIADVTNFKVWSESYATASSDELIMQVAPVHGTSDMEFDLTHFSFLNGTISDGKTTATGDVYIPFRLDDELVVDAGATSTRGEAFDCESISPISRIHLTCKGPGRVLVKGRYDDIRVSGEAQLTNVSVEGYNIGDADGRFDYHNLLLRFLDVKGKKNRTTYQGEAALNWRAYLGQGPNGKALGRPRTKRDTLHVTVAARNVKGRAEDIRAVIPPGWGNVMEFLRTLPMTGDVEGWADARGAVGDATTEDLTFETEFNLGAITLYDQQFDGTHVSAHMDHKNFYFDDLTLDRSPSRWHAVGPISRAEGAMKIDARISEMPLAQLNALEGVGSPVHGRFDAVINARGTVSDWQGPVRIDVTDVAYGDIPIGDGQLDLMMGGGRIKGAGTLFDGRAEMNYAMKLESPWVYTADLEFYRGPAQDIVGPNALPKGVLLSFGGKVHAAGALSYASKSTGHASLEKVSLSYRNLALTSPDEVKLSFAGPKVGVDKLVLVTDDGSKLDLKGHASANELDLQLGVQGDLSLARTFMTSVTESHGPFTFTLGISGTPEEPVMVGQGRINDGLIVVDGFAHHFKDVESNISFIRDKIVFDPLTFYLDESPVKGSAEVFLKGYSIGHISLVCRFQDLRFRIPDYLPTRLSGRINMEGLPEEMLLTGEVDVLEARYTEPWDWENLTQDFRRRRLAPRVYDKDKEWLNMDVHLRADDKIYVQNNNMDAEFRGDLHLTGTNERVGLIGTLTAIGGRATYRNNVFEIGRSTVDFVERQRIAVVVDVEATTHVKGYDVWVDVEGPVEQLSAEHGIRMRSNPDLPPVDIAALIVFGLAPNDVNDIYGAGRTAAFAGGLDFLASATGVDKEVRKALPGQVIDEFYLTSRTPRKQTGAVQGSVPALVVGTEFWGGTRLRFTSTIVDASGGNTQPDQSLEWEKRWGKHLSGRVVWDRNSQLHSYGDLGADVKYRWEF
ncbi:MAG: translocation/assembly module TamB domain-containing protein [Myxococcota bacterium]